jgi:hypothetical protein
VFVVCLDDRAASVLVVTIVHAVLRSRADFSANALKLVAYDLLIVAALQASRGHLTALEFGSPASVGAQTRPAILGLRP